MTEAPDLIALLERRAADAGRHPGFTFLSDGGADARNLEFAGLLRRARAVAALLQAHARPGARVLLLYPPGLDYICAFFGCLLGGQVAVPAYPPGLAARHRKLQRLETIVTDAGADIVLTTGKLLASLGTLARNAPGLARARWLASDDLPEGAADGWRRPDVEPATLAMLQYTSGSTGTPKGVMLTHANLLANARGIQQVFALTPDSVCVGWLPLYHDMGLMGHVVHPVYAGFHCVLMPPQDFIARPMRWLKAIARFGGTVGGGPNFAYDLCVRNATPALIEGLDLRSWSLAFTGAEPVRAATLDRFARTFAACGFRRAAFLPCYGLAEATLFVSGKPIAADYTVTQVDTLALQEGEARPASAGAAATTLVGCGSVAQAPAVLAVDPATCMAVPEGRVGEIWVAGPHVAAGYWGDAGRTRDVFGAMLAADPDGRCYLRTGDLGFIAAGELYLSARVKDLIILRGRNFYPQDIEYIAEEAHPALRAGACAAFAVDAGGQDVLVVTVEADPRALARDPDSAAAAVLAVRRALGEQLDLHAHEIILLKGGTLPKTSSGKVQRHACRAAYLDGSLARVAPAPSVVPAPADPAALTTPADLPEAMRAARVREHVRAEAARVAGIPAAQVDAAAPVAALGIDSLGAVALVHALERDLGIGLSAAPLLQGETIAQFSERVLAALAALAPGPGSTGGGMAGAAGPFALSAGQEALWLLHRLRPDSPALAVTTALRLRGPLRPDALETALRALAGRHPALHTVFEADTGKPVQRPRPALAQAFALERHDAAPLGEAALSGEIAAFARRPFDLDDGPLFRAALYSAGPGDHVLALAAHHIAVDLWSVAILLDDLEDLYREALDETAPRLVRPAGGDYRAFVADQQASLAADREVAARYWQDRTAGVPPLALNYDHAPPAQRGFRGDAVTVDLAPDVARQVDALAAAAGCTPFVVLLAAWQALLARYSGQCRFLLGAPLSGRTRAAHADTVGYFVDMLPLCADLGGRPTFMALLERVRAEVAGAVEHQGYPPVPAQGMPAGATGHPPFSCVFTLDHAPSRRAGALAALVTGERAGARFAGLEACPFALATETTQFDLTLRLVRGPSGIGGSLVFDRDLFERDSMTRMARNFATLLHDAVARPARRVDTLAALALDELAVLAALSRGAVEPLLDGCVHDLVAASARRDPARLAVRDAAGEITYAQLQERAARLTRRLRDAGVRPGDFVGLVLERGVPSAVGALGVLGAGAAYVPIDARLPAARIAYMLADSRARAVVAGPGARPPVPDNIVMLALPDDADGAPAHLSAAPRTSPAAPAYCIYTSGSTGRPKGVVVRHRELMHLVRWHQQQFGLGPDDRCTLAASPSFDASVWETWPALACGATLIAPDDDTRQDAAALAAWLVREQVTVGFVPTPLAGGVLEALAARDPAAPALRFLLTGGERLARRPAPDAAFELVNCYGPTECTVVSTFGAVAPASDGRPPPIGLPVSNTTVRVLDASLDEVPLGAVGELCIGGAGVAAGYLGRPGLTAERFCPDPHALVPGARMYRSGDLVRWRDGQLDYVGRADSQVKVRGVRVELEEIEALLRELPGVGAAVVLARPAPAGDTRLAAFVTASGAAEPSALRTALAARLPGYMVPREIVQLDALPLTPQGKVDRQALLAIPVADAAAAPLTADDPVTALLAGLWEDLLGAPPAGADDDFFERGGHSLLAAQLLARLEAASGARLRLRDLFDAPTFGKLAARVRAHGGVPAAPLERIVTNAPPLSFAQERMWFLDRLEPGSPAYNVAGALRLSGPLDVQMLRRALDEVVRRHEALRTTFDDDGGVLVARVHEPSALALPVLDLAASAQPEREARLALLLIEEAERGFDLARGPLLRARLVRLGAEEHVLCLTLHHIVADGWSVRVLGRETSAFYRAFCAGAAPQVPPLPVQYGDYARWHRAALQGDRLAALRDYWTGALADMPRALELPTDRTRPAMRDHRGAVLARRLDAPARARLARFARAGGATPFMVLLAAYALLLARHTGQGALIVGTPVANRTRPETEGLVGLFANTLALGLRPGDAATFADMVAQARTCLLDAAAHQDFPFERVVEALHVERDLSRTPLVQAMCSMQGAPAADLALPGIRVQPANACAGVAKFDLTLAIQENGTEYVLHWEYATGLFDAATIERMAGHFERLLDAGIADPQRCADTLPLEDRDAGVLRGPHAERGPGLTLVDLFEAQAARTPDAPAIMHGADTWSYALLEGRADAVAAALRAEDVGLEQRVAVRMHASGHAVAAILGVLKAGAAWVPVDADAPDGHVQALLAGGGVRLVLADPALAAPAAACGLRVLDPAAIEEALPHAPAAACRASARNAAYVIHTSGTSGAPKGVLVEHASAVNYVLAFGARLGLSAGDRLLQSSSLAFDVSVEEIFGALAHGAALVLRTEAMRESIEHLIAGCAGYGATVLDLPTAFWNELTRAMDDGLALPAAVRAVVIGGEQAQLTALERWRRHAPHVRLLNAYGPTETTIAATWADLDRLPPGQVPIGRPVDNTLAWVLDAAGRTCPTGVPGELVIGGAALARGYLDWPAATAERFVPAPDGAGRAYRTGDRVMRLADGQLAYLGRLDRQCKIRGFRVEPEAVEAALRRLPQVRDAVVLRQGQAPDLWLAAYVVCEGDVDAVRAALPEQLPAYMLPAVFIPLAALPLLPNGKLDQGALPPARRAPRTAGPPRNDLEHTLVRIWREVLGVAAVGIHDNFFDIGGHSLLAMRAVSRLGAALGAEVTLRMIFEAPTPAALAAAVARLPRHSGRSIPVRPGGAPPAPASHAQARLWFLDQLLPGSAAYNMALALRLHGALDATALSAAIDAVVRRHEVLRTRLVADAAGEPVQVVDPAPAGLMAYGDLSRESEPHGAAQAAAEREAAAPFDLARGPLMRARLLAVGPGEHVLLVTIHHAACDGWSVAVLTREVLAFYREATTRHPAGLAPLPLQYGDYAAWERGRMDANEFAPAFAWWQRHLDGAPPLLELPADRPRPPLQSFHGGAFARPLGPDLSARLDALAHELGATPFMVLLAAFALFLGRHAQQQDVVIGTPAANRPRTELEPLAGLFVNTLALRIDLAGRPSFAQIVERVRQVTLDAHVHQGLPFEKLVEALGLPRDAGHPPVFQAMFILQNAPVEEPALPGIAVESIAPATHTAKFDLTLDITPGAAGYVARWEYAIDLFERETVQHMAARFERLLHALDGVAVPADRLPLMPEAEARSLRAHGAGPVLPHDEGAGLAGLFARRVAATPDAPALIGDAGEMTYAQLDAQSRALAQRLAPRGVTLESRVGVCLARSAESVAAMIAIVRIGAAWVPLDPAAPPARLAYIAADAGVALVVTRGPLWERVGGAGWRGVRPVLLEDSAPHVHAPAPDRPVHPASLAYVIYTSGSTGVPKGVMGLNGATVNRLRWMWEQLPFGVGERACLKTSIGFVDAVWETFGGLLAGVPTVIVDDEAGRDAGRLVDVLARHAVTRIVLVPSLLRAILEIEACPARRLPHLATWITSGEALPAPLARAFAAALPRARLVNLYGQSEAAADATWHAVDDTPYERIPIGRPLANVSASVLDDEGRSVPPGVAGHLHVGGAGLARGYIGKPAWTAEHFVPDPEGAAPGARIYRTGDRARWLPAGELDFLGRIDGQVKVRGVRVEPGEIAAALRSTGGVRDVAVVARPGPDGDVRIVAYVVPEAGVQPGALHAQLRGRLPGAMLPAAIVALGALPLTTNGKLDKAALPEPDLAALAGAPHVAPRDEAERTIARIWEDVLGTGQVGIHDNFFALGGHSLAAARAVARIRGDLGRDLALQALFDFPTIAELAPALAASARGTPPRVPAKARDGTPLPLSYAQERLWFLEQLDPGNAAYNLPLALYLRGRLDAAAFSRAFDMLVRRHEVLRTTFATDDGDAPRQHVGDGAAICLDTADLRGADDPLVAARDAAACDAVLPFDLARGPLLRARLLCLDDSVHVFLLTIHHAVSDRWSMEILLRELAALYEAAVAGTPPGLAPLRIQYADYAAWQRDWLAGPELARQLAFWTRHLAGAPHALDLPTDRPRPAAQTFAGGALSCPLGAELSTRLDACCERLQATPFMVLFAAFAALLGRHTGQTDIVIGTPIANRALVDLEPLVGLFVNTLALRTDLSGRPSFDRLVADVKARALAAYAHQDLPFERLVEALNVPRDLNRSPVFQVVFAMQDTARGLPRLVDLTVDVLEVAASVAQFDLSVEVVPEHGGYDVLWEFNTDLFDAATVHGMARRLRLLLAGALDAPGRSVDDLRLLDDGEEAVLLAAGRGEAWPCPGERCVHARFSQQARSTPEMTALADERTELSYRELDALTDRIAAGLRARGIAAGERVALCMPRSVELIAGMLGVMKAGAAYVPVDPGYPAARIAFLLRDSAAAAVLDSDDIVRLAAAPAASLPVVHPLQAAYVIHTSGSSGNPKGVVVPHRSVTNYVLAFGRQFGLAPGDRFLQFASPSFDQSVEEIFAPLLHGATLVLRSDAMIATVEDFVASCERLRITVLELPTAYWNELALGLAGGAVLPACVRLVAFGGETAAGATLARWRRAAPRGVRLLNGYGPTEATVGATNHEPGDAEPGDIPIGRPIANVQVYVLDERMRLAPQGVVGELCIGGDGVARGYLGCPAATAERYVPDPFGPGRLYRTGDAVRWRPHGELEFMGRLDNQVKVRGFRIDPAEIENVLCRQPGVRDAAVAPHEAQPGDRRLVAYVVLEPGTSTAALAAALRAALPEYMVPGRFVTLDRLPLSPAGKVDRRALAPPAAAPSAVGTAPATPAEIALAAIWRDVLKLDRVALEDNFFALGGHSLLATRVASRIRKVFGIEPELRLLFVAPTLGELAARLAGGARPEGAALEALPRDGSPLPVSFAQERMWFLEHLEPGSATYNMPFTLRLKGALDVRVLGNVFTEIVGRHESLRTTFDVGPDGVPRQHIHAHVPAELDVTDLRGTPRPEAAANAKAASAARQPFDLRRGPLLRTRLLRIADDDHLLLVTIHHIVSDGWSTDVLMREVTTLYQAFAQGRPSPLRPLAIQYADFAAWQRAWLTDAELQRQVAFWKRTLAGAPPAHDLLTDRPRPAAWTFQGDSLTRMLGGARSARVDAFARQAGATPFIILMAVFGALVGRYSRQHDVVIGTPFSNRTRTELEELIGFFVNVLPLRVDLSGACSFDQLVARVKEATLGAYAHQDLPFDKLVEALNMPRDKSRSPVFQLAMTLEMPEATPANLKLDGLDISTVEIDTGAAKFDLVLIAAPTPDGYEANWQFNTALFDRDTVERIARHFEQLLDAALHDPGQPVAWLPLLSVEEQREIALWSRARRSFDSGDSIHGRFMRRAAESPDARAVSARDATLTYGQLADRALRLAAHLRRRGVRAGDIVALRTDRNAGMVVCVLAILMAGAAYLPIDRHCPPGRATRMIEESGVRHAVVGGAQGALFEDAALCVVDVDVDAEAAAIAAQAPAAPAPVHANALAYVIYTSGSTGRPKGVEVAHASVVRLFDAAGEHFDFGPSDVWTLFHSIAFDFSVWELWGPLFLGGRLVIVSHAVSRSADDFYALLVRERVTVLNQTPSAFRQLMQVDALERETLALRYVIFGGEALDIASLKPWFDLHGDSDPALVNMYGITETTVHTTVQPVTAADLESGSLIGRPLADLALHLLDPAGQPVPVGVAGEIHVGGAGLARGYRRQGALSAERFVPDPDGAPGARLYRSGDLARYRPDGDIEFLGRADRQIKLRGFRIEPGEIESVLRAQPGVHACAVVVRGTSADERRLVAYVTGVAGAAALRDAAERRLPEYMVPSAFVSLAALPLTPNGKLDVNALPDPEAASLAVTSAYAAPRNPGEERLAQIWRDVLKIERVGIHDNFFELGGHSLLAAQMAARISRELHVDLRLGAIFAAPSIGELALKIGPPAAAAPAPAASRTLVELRAGTGVPLVLVHAVGGGVSAYLKLVRHVPAGRPVYAFQSTGLEGAQAPLATIGEMAERYLEELRRIRPDGPYQLGGWSMGGLVAFEMACRLERAGASLPPLVLFDCPAPPSLLREALPAWTLGAYLQELVDAAATDVGLAEADLDALARDPRRDERAMQIARDHGLVPRDMADAELAARVATYAANVRAVAGYLPASEAALHIVSLRGADSAFPEGWSRWTRGRVTTVTVPGNHYTMLDLAGPVLGSALEGTAS